eukprot:15163767-Alexandrium_andersonii.AAC.1
MPQGPSSPLCGSASGEAGAPRTADPGARRAARSTAPSVPQQCNVGAPTLRRFGAAERAVWLVGRTASVAPAG